jgi:predicted transcriptional regulator
LKEANIVVKSKSAETTSRVGVASALKDSGKEVLQVIQDGQQASEEIARVTGLRVNQVISVLQRLVSAGLAIQANNAFRVTPEGKKALGQK